MALMDMAATMIFTDCSSSSSSSSTARLLHFTSTKVQKLPNTISRFHRSNSLQFGISNPRFSRTIITHCSSSSISAIELNNEASATVIDGKRVAKDIREEVAVEISRMKDEIGIVPGLAVILVGDRKDSATYVRNKKKACDSVGINSYEVRLAEDSSEEEVLKHISKFNDDPSVHGILVQLPLPSNILNAVCIEKDVDGFHPLNIGRLAMRGREPLFVPCTPKGCIELLHRYDIPIKGKRAVREDATVSIVHSRTKNPEEITRQADIVISAVGQPNMVRGSWVKPGADPESPRGYRLVGDICYEEASKVASAITPVPGGVGPMTIAMLLSNTLLSAKRVHNFR
ncbi:NAD(P)-binding domain-containing protein [Cynara cardunculus var. scolymus]|uniref:NAD(P)-binding domain-containing protein n=1 Tax=Cynara cardunculus var. scolymus TaxID=59895 RepID=A0A103XE91_CYNCS|nr:NAD(P)-binding domain-containing protein [Cynara cardunculus var. scolymus]